MLVKTQNGTWLNAERVAFIDPLGSTCKACFSGRGEATFEDYVSVSQPADELAALLNGAAGPRMVELTIATRERKPLLVSPEAVAFVSAAMRYNLTGEPEPNREMVDTSYVQMEHLGEDGCYRVIGSYEDIKRLLFGESEVPA